MSSTPPWGDAMSTGDCRNCQRPRKRRATGGLEGGDGLCGTCYNRRWRAGRTEGDVPPATPIAERMASARVLAAVVKRELMEERIADYVRLRALGFRVAQAADDVGVSVWTARYKYEPRYRAVREGRAA